MTCMFYLAQLVKYDVRTTRKIKFIHAIIYNILLLSARSLQHERPVRRLYSFDGDEGVC